MSADRKTLRERVRGVFVLAAVAAAVMLLVGILAFLNLLDARSAVMDDLDPAQVAADGLFNGLLSQQNAVRGLLLTGSDAFLDNFESATAQVDAAADDLRRLVAGLPELEARVGALIEASASWRDEYALVEIEAREAGREVPPDVVDASREVFDQIRVEVADLNDDIALRRERARADLEDATRTLIAALGGSVLTLLAIAVALRVGLRRWVTQPLEQLGGETRLARLGELDRSIEPVGPPEIRELALAVEAMRQRIQDDLTQAQETSAELAELTDDLSRSNRDLEQFAYVASHDLQEPLRKVTSFCQLLQQRYGGQLDERADQYIEFAVDGAKRMQLLINDLLAFSRVGRLSGEPEPIDLDRPLQRALDILADRIEETGATIEHGDLPEVCAEPSLLSAVFQNLIGNALKFQRPGIRPEVRVSVTEAGESGEAWEVAVADNGIGIEPEYADRVFVIFQRLHTKDEYSGTGIGLALCRRIIEHHGGHIWVDTTVGEGTTIRFTLPRPVEPPEPEPVETAEPVEATEVDAAAQPVGEPTS
jgi:signal transduction histidine kinase